MTQPDLPEPHGVASVTGKHGCTLHIVHGEVHQKPKGGTGLFLCFSADTANVVSAAIYSCLCSVNWKWIRCVEGAREKG